MLSEFIALNVSTIQVLNSKNERIDNSKFTIIGDHDCKAQTELNTKKLADGVYTVSWMTQSADDGHIARGSYVFGIGSVGPGVLLKALRLVSGRYRIINSNVSRQLQLRLI